MVDVLFKTGNRLYLYKQEAIQQRSETQTFNPAGINMLLAAQRQIDVFNDIGVFSYRSSLVFCSLKSSTLTISHIIMLTGKAR